MRIIGAVSFYGNRTIYPEPAVVCYTTEHAFTYAFMLDFLGQRVYI